jgi:hypothetical protein
MAERYKRLRVRVGVGHQINKMNDKVLDSQVETNTARFHTMSSSQYCQLDMVLYLMAETTAFAVQTQLSDFQ